MPRLMSSLQQEPAELSVAIGAAPRYRQLTALLAREIELGRYPVGSLLPPEPLLGQRFAVSRHTVREAVRQLCDQGLVSRHQGVGTRVLMRRSDKQYTASLSSLSDLMAYTQQTRLKLLGSRRVEAGTDLARQLQCEQGQTWLELDTCRLDVKTEQPIVHMRVYVRLECEGILRDLEIGDAWVYGLIEKHGRERIVEARQVVGAVAVDEQSARLLGVDAQSPGLLIRRFYLGRNDRLLSVSVNVYPMGRFEFVTRWRLEDSSLATTMPASQVRTGG